jgi:PAS domain S-box-containing protein
MKVAPRATHVTLAHAFAPAAAVVGVMLGVTGMVGWVTGNEAIKTFLHDKHLAMNPMTAVCFILGGMALWFAQERGQTPGRNRARLILSGLVVGITFLKVLDLMPRIEIGIDQVLFGGQIGKIHMAPNTAVGLLLLGLSLLLLEWERIGIVRPSTLCALLSAAVALLALTGYIYSVQVLVGMPSYIAMAINTAVGMFAMSIGVLCVRPERQPIALLVSSTAGGVVARRLVPVALVIPLVLGWVRLEAERRGLFESAVGVMLFALAIVATFLTLIWLIARALYRLDIERARAEAAAADQYQLMRTLIDNLPDRIYAKDREGRFLISNAAHTRILGGESPEKVRGKRDDDFWPAAQAKLFHAEEARIIDSGEPMVDQEQRRTTREGEERWVTVTKVPFRTSTGAVAGIVGITHDVTAMKQAQSMLREQNEMLEHSMKSEHEAHEGLKKAQSQLVQSEKLASLGQMVAGVAHEINNPLSFVANNVAVLQRDLKALGSLLELYKKAEEGIAEKHPDVSGEIRELSERIDLGYTLPNLQDLLARSREGLRRIQQIVKDLRDFARLDESDLHEIDLNEGIRSTANIIAGVAKRAKVKVDLDLGNLPQIACYPAKINQVVMNLLANAIQASPENSTVTVRSHADNGAIVIDVIDHGSGIPAKIRDRIFDPFFTTKPPGEGTGLGLSISYGIVQDHDGRIDVQSEEGKGTTFTVRLPVRKSAAKD